MCVCVCSMVRLVEGRAEAGRRTEAKRTESESPSARTPNLVRGPGPAGALGEREEAGGRVWDRAAR